jgi:Flp pilus assembly protein TadG
MKTSKRFAKARGGSTLIEFALLAPIFFLMVTGLVEFVLYQYKTYALNHVVYEATRNLQTGEIQGAGDAAAQAAAFHDEVCDQAGAMIDCERIVFDVRSYGAIEDVEFPDVTFDEDGNPIGWVFAPGGPEQFSVVRASIHHVFITPFMAELFGMGPDLPAIVNAFCIVRNEPWA